jgi:hypothetical protein
MCWIEFSSIKKLKKQFIYFDSFIFLQFLWLTDYELLDFSNIGEKNKTYLIPHTTRKHAFNNRFSDQNISVPLATDLETNILSVRVKHIWLLFKIGR